MGVFVIVQYVVKPERQAEFMPCMDRINRYVKTNPNKFKEWKSFRLYSKMNFDIMNEYMELWGFNNMAELEKIKNRLSKDKGWTKLIKEIVSFIDPATMSITIWEDVKT